MKLKEINIEISNKFKKLNDLGLKQDLELLYWIHAFLMDNLSGERKATEMVLLKAIRNAQSKYENTQISVKK